MEDELEDKVLYQTFLSYSKFVSKIIMSIPVNTNHIGYTWRMIRFYVLKPEIIFVTILLALLILYVHTAGLYTRSVLQKLGFSYGEPAARFKIRGQGSSFNNSSGFEFSNGNIGVFAVQGRRPHMEDRFVAKQNIEDTGISLFAVFDGHGGEFAAEYAKQNLINSLRSRIIEMKLSNENKENMGYHQTPTTTNIVKLQEKKLHKPKKKPLVKKSISHSDDMDSSLNNNSYHVDNDLLLMLERLLPVRKNSNPIISETSFQVLDSFAYIENGIINYSRLLTDEVLAADRLLVDSAKRTKNIAGTTALIALVEGKQLIVANVGDSRGVMCDYKGNTIPLSFDHKPEQMREKKRIQEAGGFISFNGVWRVAGILATSRALGDYPLKDRKLVIADPDILTFDLSDYKPQFLIFASDGLWDTFTNEEAVAFIKEHINEPLHGAKSITLQSYFKGSQDNITVIVINLLNHDWTDTTSNMIVGTSS